MTRPRPALRAEVRITEIPEALALARKELAQILRDAAADEDPRVAARLHEIAALFESGQLRTLDEDP